jgi:hypothetical protein
MHGQFYRDHERPSVEVEKFLVWLANQPDTVLHDKRANTSLLINITMPDDSNINKKD